MQIFGNTERAEVTPTISTSIYTAGDVVGGLMTFDVGSPGGGGVVQRLLIVDDDNEKAAGKLYLFNAAPTTIADQDAFAPVVADLKKLVAVIAVAAGDYTTINSNAYAIKEDLNDAYEAGDTGKLYGYFVCDATPTYTAVTDLFFALTCWLD